MEDTYRSSSLRTYLHSSSTSLPGRVKLHIVSFIHTMFFYSCRSKVFELDTKKAVQRHCSFCGLKLDNGHLTCPSGMRPIYVAGHVVAHPREHIIGRQCPTSKSFCFFRHIFCAIDASIAGLVDFYCAHDCIKTASAPPQTLPLL